MKKENITDFFVLTFCYILVILTIMCSNGDFTKELITVFGLYTYMIFAIMYVTKIPYFKDD